MEIPEPSYPSLDPFRAPRSSSAIIRRALGLIGPSRTALPWGFFPYDVSETRAATNTELTSLGCATPLGFLNLLTFYSTQVRTALFHAESVYGVVALRGFPLPIAAMAFTTRCPGDRLRFATSTPPQYRSEEQYINHASRLVARSLGLMHLGRSVHDELVLPSSAGRSPHSLCAPPRISPLEPRPLRRKTSSHGLFHNAGQVHRYGRSPECQRTRRSLASFENCFLLGIHVLGTTNLTVFKCPRGPPMATDRKSVV